MPPRLNSQLPGNLMSNEHARTKTLEMADLPATKQTPRNRILSILFSRISYQPLARTARKGKPTLRQKLGCATNPVMSLKDFKVKLLTE